MKVYNVSLEINIEYEAESSTIAEKNVLEKMQQLLEGSELDQLCCEVDVVDVT